MRKPQRLVPYSENKGYASNLRRFPPNVLGPSFPFVCVIPISGFVPGLV